MSHTLRLAVLLLLAACATGTRPVASAFTRTVGQSSERHILGTLPDILQRHAYRVKRSATSTGLLTIETEWRQRDVFPAEARAGIEQARTRLFITADRRGEVYQITLKAESEGRNLGDDRWTPLSSSHEFELWIRRLVADLEGEYSSTGRR